MERKDGEGFILVVGMTGVGVREALGIKARQRAGRGNTEKEELPLAV